MKPSDSPTTRDDHAMRHCLVCGKLAVEVICDTCAMRIHLDALGRKTHEEQGNAWGKWESTEHIPKHRH